MKINTPPVNADCDELNRRYGAPGRIVFRPSETGRPSVALANQYGSAEVQLFGAQIMQYRPTGNQPVFYNSHPAVFDPTEDVHGGCPVCWPWFGRNGEPGSRGHGFARISPWCVRATEYSEDETTLVLALVPTDATRALWPYEFDLEYRISLSMKLNLALKTTNTGTAPFLLTEGFHPYFRVRDRDAVTVRGVDGCVFCDARKGRDFAAVWTGDAPMTTDYDHVFRLEKHEHVLLDPGLRRAIAVVSRGNNKLVVWNPGPFAPGELRGVEPDDWKKFVCVEPATLFREDGLTIQPGETHELLAAIQSVPDDGSVHPLHA